MTKIRRTGVTEKNIKVTYTEIQRLGNPMMLDLRRAIPQYCSTTIGKCIGELKDRGIVERDDRDWPPRFRIKGDYA